MLKQFYKENKSISIIVILYLTVTILDLISTISVKDVYIYLESNILFPYIGIMGIFIVNLIIIFFASKYYINSKDAYLRFLVLFAITTFIVVKILIVINNFLVGLNPPSLQEAKLITLGAKFFKLGFFTLLNILPFIIAIITYLLFQKDHRIKIK